MNRTQMVAQSKQQRVGSKINTVIQFVVVNAQEL